MIDEIINIFSMDFVQRAFAGGILISLCCALLGVTLVLKQFSMIGDGLSHVAFGSLAIATVLGFAPMYFTIPVVIIAAFLLLRLKDSKINSDSAIALISISSLAIGVLFISGSSGANTDIYSYMFGSILALTKKDILITIVLSLLIIFMYIYTYNKMFVITFDEKFAKSTGINTDLYNIIISMLTAITIVTGMKMMGSMLISALIIFPALTAMRIFKTFKSVVIISTIVSVFSFVAGMMLCVIFNTPAGATIVAVDIFIFTLFSIVGKILNK